MGGFSAYAAQNRLEHRDGTRTLRIEKLSRRDRDGWPSLVVRPVPGRPLPAAYAPSMALFVGIWITGDGSAQGSRRATLLRRFCPCDPSQATDLAKGSCSTGYRGQDDPGLGFSGHSGRLGLLKKCSSHFQASKGPPSQSLPGQFQPFEIQSDLGQTRSQCRHQT